MKRRTLCLLPALLGLPLCDALALPRITVSLAQLERALSQRFPIRKRISGLAELTLRQPQLRLLPADNRLAAQLVLEATGPALQGAHTGVLDVDFSLRYEASDQSLRAHRLRVHALRIEGLPQEQAQVLEALAPLLARQSLREVVLHRLEPGQLALADGMGLEPGDITVTAGGLAIDFVEKRRPAGPDPAAPSPPASPQR